MRKSIFLIMVISIFFMSMEKGFAFSCLDYFSDDYDLSYKSVHGLIEYQDESKQIITKFYLELDLYGGNVGKVLEEFESRGLRVVSLSISTTEGVFETAYPPKGHDYADMGMSIDAVFEGQIDVDSWKELYDKYRFRIDPSNEWKSWRSFFSLKEKRFILIRDNDLGWGRVISVIENAGFRVRNIKMKNSEEGTVVGIWVEKVDDSKNLRDMIRNIREELGVENIEDIIRVSFKHKAREEYNEFFEKGIFVLGEKIVGFFRYLFLEY